MILFLEPISKKYGDVCSCISVIRTKVKNRSHYEKYIFNTMAIFKEAVNNEIPIVVFTIAGYPGDKE